MSLYRKVNSLVLCLSLLSAEQVLACASCGSGGDEPLILYPNESQKIYLGMSRASGFQSANESGMIHPEDAGPQNKTTVQFSYGKSLGSRSFVTLGIPFIANSHSRKTEYGYGDPVASGRYTILPMTMANPFIPQVQLLASYKPTLAKSVHESTDTDGLDVFGSGYHQFRAGIDVWSGMSWLQLGVAQIVGFSPTKTVSEHKLEPGTEYKTVFSLGHSIESVGKLVLGISRLFIAERKDQGKYVAHSEQINHAIFATGEYTLDPVSTMRLTLARQAAVFNNRNTLRSDSLAIAYMRSF